MAARTLDPNLPTGPQARGKSARRGRAARLLAALGVVAAAVLVHLGALGGPFLFDDLPGIVENPNLRSLWPLARALDAPEGTGADGRPLVALSLALDHALWGLDPFGFRLTNLALHGLTALALLGAIGAGLRLAGSGARALPLAVSATLLWAVHPLHTGALHHVIYRNEVLAGLFYLLALQAALRLFERPRARSWAVLCVLATAAAMASKELAVSLPLAVLALDRLYGAGGWRAALRARRGLYVGLAATWPVLAACVLSGSRGESVGFGHLEVIGPLDSLYTQAGALTLYLRLALWPRPLVFDYEGWAVVRDPLAALPAGALLLALLGWSAWAFARRRGAGFLGLASFAILAPSSSFIPLAGDLVAERRMYLPLAALALLAVLLAARLLAFAPLAPGVRRALALLWVLAPAAALGTATVQRCRDYTSTERIWRDTVTKRPDNPRAWNMLGVELAGQGRGAEAEAAYARALELAPRDANASFNLANLCFAAGRWKEAAEHYGRAARRRPERPEVRFNHGSALILDGRPREGLEEWRAALALDPDSTLVRRRLAFALATHPDAGVRDGAEALALAQGLGRGEDAEAADLDVRAAALAELGRFEEAARTAERAAARARAEGRPRQAATFAERAAAYAAGRPWRQAHAAGAGQGEGAGG